jgi:hypothetical protein
LLIAVITAFLAVLMIADGAGGGGEGIVRIIAGVLLVALALVVGVLSLFPAQIARWARRPR